MRPQTPRIIFSEHLRRVLVSFVVQSFAFLCASVSLWWTVVDEKRNV
jgi:hypothetical protein